jgi:hypothetical protein
MTKPRAKGETLSETTKSFLVDVFVSENYNRYNEISGKYLDKGNDVEEDSITTVSRITGKFLKKNEDSLSNEFIKGTPDLFVGDFIESAEIIRDTKSSWDAYTFFRAKNKGLLDAYKWQGTGYMWLTGAKKCFIDYCLNNTPYHLVESELRRESYNHPEGDTPAWIELQIIANHVYDFATFNDYIHARGIVLVDDNSKSVFNSFIEIPLKQRHFSFEFDRDENEIEELKEKIIECRKYINENLFNI